MSALNRQYESMTQLVTQNNWRVRVWVTEEKFTMGPRVAVEDAIRDLCQSDFNAAGAVDSLVRALDRLRHDGVPVAAFEIVDDNGDGAVVKGDLGAFLAKVEFEQPDLT